METKQIYKIEFQQVQRLHLQKMLILPHLSYIKQNQLLHQEQVAYKTREKNQENFEIY